MELQLSDTASSAVVPALERRRNRASHAWDLARGSHRVHRDGQAVSRLDGVSPVDVVPVDGPRSGTRGERLGSLIPVRRRHVGAAERADCRE